MDKKKLQQAFIQYLALKYQLKSQQELQAKAQELGEEGMKKEYAEFIQYMQQQGVQVARLGAKLNYLRQLRGKCPEGYEVAYYKQGGKTCAVCLKVGTQQQGGNVVEDFKKKRKVEKAQRGNRARRTVTEVKRVTTFPEGLEARSRTVQYFDDGTSAVQNSGWRNNMWEATYRGRRGEFGSTTGTPRLREIADSLYKADWKTGGGPGPNTVFPLKKQEGGNIVQPTSGGYYSNQTFRENGRPVRYESYQDPNGNWYNLRTQGNDSTFYFNSDNGNPNGASPNFEGSKTNGQLNVPQSSWNGAVKVWDMIKNWVSNGQVQK